MALAPFFDRVYGAIGGHLPVSKEALTSTLEDVIVGIRCKSPLTQNDICIAEFATNILARLYPRILINSSAPYEASLRNLASKINPKIEFMPDAPGQGTICLGSAIVEGALYPSASGWVARLLHSNPEPCGPWNPYASGAAASLATAELFRRVFISLDSEPDLILSLLDYTQDTGSNLELTTSDIERTLFVGVGAIGNAALWALARHESLKGELSLVDEDTLLLPNLQRYVLGTFKDVPRPKVRLGGRELSLGKLNVKAYRQKLESLAQKTSGINIPNVCISVDNISTRRAAQALLPKLIINGWTGDQALGTSWHIFAENVACLACLYHPQGQGLSQPEQAAKALGLAPLRATELWISRTPLSLDDLNTIASTLRVRVPLLDPWRGKSLSELYTGVICGAVPLDLPTVGRMEVVPLAHQSALAGILMATELVKRTNPVLNALSQPETLVGWDDILRKPPPANKWQKPRQRESGCICGDPVYQSIYAAKWNGRSVVTQSVT